MLNNSGGGGVKTIYSSTRVFASVGDGNRGEVVGPWTPYICAYAEYVWLLCLSSNFLNIQSQGCVSFLRLASWGLPPVHITMAHLRGPGHFPQLRGSVPA